MVSLLLYDLPASESYQIVFMERDLDEVLASQEQMLNRLGKTSAPREQMKRAYALHLERLHKWLGQQRNFSVLCVSYNDLLEEAARQTERVRDFLGIPLNVEKMAQTFDASLYRNRRNG